MRSPLPGQHATYLIDLSHNNARADLRAAQQSGIAGVFLKATEGATWRDPVFAHRLAAARQAGLLVGVLHFGTAAPVAGQLDNFIGAVQAAGGNFATMAAALDLESNAISPANTMTPAMGEAWVAGFRQQTGATPLLYAGDYLRGRGGATARPGLAACPLWVAQYASHAQALPGWADWTIWQYTDGKYGPYAGPVPGISPFCDQDVFRGGKDDLAALWASLGPPPSMA